MSHTPGPWEVFWIASPAGTSARIFSDATEPATDIAHIPMAWNGDGSNARLIAAAPDLLATLREIAAGRLDHEHDRDDYHDRVVALARTAISKAEGE